MAAVISPVAGGSDNVNPGSAALFGVLYSELRRLARRELARQWNPQSLSVTTLLHESYLGMVARDTAGFPDHARFMAYAARVMRGIIIDRARNHSAMKRGGAFQITPLEDDVLEDVTGPAKLPDIGDALDQLEKVDASLAEIVDLRFFCGFSFAEVAAMQQVSQRTVQRKWDKARIFLHRTIRAGSSR